MSHPLGDWMNDNAELFRYAGELSCMREEAERILLSGTASAFLAPLFRTLYPDSAIIVSGAEEEAVSEVLADVPDADVDPRPIEATQFSGIDIAVSMLAVQRLETRAMTGYLFSLHDSLAEGGNLLLSFPAEDALVLSPMREIDSWYAMDRKERMKRYRAEDVLQALSLIGFSVRAIESDRNADLGTVVSIHAVRR